MILSSQRVAVPSALMGLIQAVGLTIDSPVANERLWLIPTIKRSVGILRGLSAPFITCVRATSLVFASTRMSSSILSPPSSPPPYDSMYIMEVRCEASCAGPVVTRGAISFNGYVKDSSEKWAVSPCACTTARPLPWNTFLRGRATPDFEAIVERWASGGTNRLSIFDP